MEADSLIQAFRQLSTVPRHRVLGALVEQLTPYEWRDLQQQLNARDFRCDIVGSLPLELVVHVFAYLDLIEVFRLQLVSRRWNHVLCSPDLLNAKLKAWYGEVPPSDDAVRRVKAEHISRLCTGRPYERVDVPILDVPCASVLVKDTLAWISKDTRSLRICNLRTGQTVRAHSEGRRRVYLIAASEEVVAYVTDSACHVMTLDGKVEKRFRVTDIYEQYITCHESIVSCGGFFSNHAMLYNYDFKTGRGETIDIALPGWQTADCRSPITSDTVRQPTIMLPDPKARTITIFSPVMEVTTDVENAETSDQKCVQSCVHYSTFTFTGDHLQDKKQYLPLLSGGASFLDFQRADSRGRLTVDAFASDDVHSAKKVTFEFDPIANEFRRPPAMIPDAGYHIPVGISWWHDACYRLVLEQEHAARGSENEHKGINDLPVSHWVQRETSLRQGTWHNLIHVNENFVVYFTSTEEGDILRVLSFEKGLQLPRVALRRSVRDY